MPDIRVRYVIDTDSLVAAQAAMQGLSNEEKQVVETFKKVNEEAVKAGKATETAAKKTDDALKHTTDSAGRVRDEFGKFVPGAKKAETAMQSLGNAAKSVGGAIAAYFTVTALIDFGKKLIEVTSQFQKFQAVLTNTLGSEVAAKAALQQIADLAAKTNFSVQELTDSYIKFANRGVKLTTDELTKLADLSNSTGKSFDQLTEAVLDAFTGENERLKEFGITAKKTGDTTKFTFKGITTEVKNTQSAISAYLFSLGALNGVQGSTAKIAETLNGQISNLGDAFDQLLVTIGNGVNGPFSGLLSFLTNYVTWVKNALKTTQQFNDELTTTRADKFVERFKTMNSEVQKATVQRLQMYVDAQAELLVVERQAREKAQKEANEAYIGEAGIVLEIEKSAREKELELSLDTNIKKIQLIKNYYDEQAKIVAKAEDPSGLISRLQKTLKALEKERELSNSRSRISQLNKEIEAGKREMDVLLGQEKEFQLKKLEIIRYYQERDFGLRGIFNRRVKDDQQKVNDEADAQRKEDERLEKEHQERKAQIVAEATQLTQVIVQGVFDLAQQNREAEAADIEIKRTAELKRVGDDKQAQAFINAKFDRQEAALKTRQAQADKQQALFNVLIQTASGIMKAVSDFPETFGLPFSAFVAAQGAIQEAVISARPIPKYAKGIEYLEGPGTTTSDSILARLSVGERVVPEGINRQLAGIPNIELPKIVAMGYEAMLQKTNINTPNNGSELHEEIKGLRRDLKKMPISSIQMDEKGFRKFVFKGDSRTQILNNQFPD